MSERMEKFRAFLAKRTGIALDADRDYMIDTRLFPVLRQKGVADVETLIDLAMAGRDEGLTQAVVEAMLTGETFFFRDKPVFDSFRNTLLPEMIAARQNTRRLRIWCAACSTGQEPYSIAMILDEEARALRGWQIEIVATDISESAIKAAKAGSYNQFEVQRGLPVTLLLRYFHREAERWQIAEHLQSVIDFKSFNLNDSFRALGEFDIIFCRNVLMYFDPDTKRDILTRLASALADDGQLLLGATENAANLVRGFEADMQVAALYRWNKGSDAGRSNVLSMAKLRA